MTHKNAQQLLNEAGELLKEFEVYHAQNEAFFAELKKLDSDYQAGKYGYIGYEEKQKAALRGRSKAEWADYYNAYMYSLLKKAEFIVAQAFALVYDDNSISRLALRIRGGKDWQQQAPVTQQAPVAVAPAATVTITKAVKAATIPKASEVAATVSVMQEQEVMQKQEVQKPPKASQAAQAARESQVAGQAGQAGRVEVFSIDNEIERLKQLLASKQVSQQQPEGVEKAEEASRTFKGRLESVKNKISANIPEIRGIASDIEHAERKAAKVRAEREKQLAKSAVKPVAKPEAVSKPVQGMQGIAAAVAAAIKSAKSAAGSAAGAAGVAVSVARAALKLAVYVPVIAARSVRGIVAKISSMQKGQAKEPARKPIFSKLPSPLALFRGRQKPAVAGAPALPLQKEGILSALKQLINPASAKKKGIFVEEIVAMEKRANVSEVRPLEQRKASAGLALGWFSVRGLLNEITEKFRSKQEPIMAERTAVPVHMKKLKEMRRRLYEEERLSGFDATLLAQEARRVKRILEVEKPEVYQGSSVGLLANLTVRKISLFLVDAFPEFFGFLYNALRAANVKVLSNTYVNIMILSTLFVTVAAFALLLPLFFMLGHPIYQIVLRGAIFSAIAGFACATVFYAYPFLKIKERRRNIMTNMPFGVNHMAAVATSGVPPASMFELISASKEYGEIGIEVKKIVDFINIFGYDLLTAIRTVAATTPSQALKEFLEGMVSTIETGGDLDSYLRQEAEQAALTYNLERQRYNETVSTYSDIYTGLLIAAPLFFVAAMALVNLLGGTLGGIGVDVVMAVGAYVVIPLLNVAFLVFLQVTQPEV